MLVWARGSHLPDRCVVCNAPAKGYRVAKTFDWHHPLVYLTLLAGILLYAIAASEYRKRATLNIGLCEEHKKRRHLGLAIAWGGAGSSLCFFFLALALEAGWIAYLGAGVLVLGPVTGLLMGRTISSTRVDDYYAWMKVGRPFLDSLPEGPPREPARRP